MKMTMAQSNTRQIGNGEALPRRAAIIFIVFLGIVSLFGDMTYEGASSIVGPYLGLPASRRRRSASFPASAN